MSANLHPDFRALQPSPLAGLCQDNNFGRELGATPADGGTAPANGFTAPDNRDTAPPMMVPPLPMDSPPLAVLCLARLLSEMMTSSSQTIQLLQALLHSGETTTEFAQRLFADQEPNKWSITVVMFIELSRQLHSLAHDRPTPARDVLPGATLKPLCCGKRSAFGSRCAALKVAVPPAALPLSRLRKKRGTATVSGSAAIIPLRYRFLSWARSGHPVPFGTLIRKPLGTLKRVPLGTLIRVPFGTLIRVPFGTLLGTLIRVPSSTLIRVPSSTLIRVPRGSRKPLNSRGLREPGRTGVPAMHACPESVQGLHALRTGVHGQHACPAGPHAKPAVLTPFVGVRHAGIFCQTKICEVLTTGNVDSYLTASTVEGQPVLRTPLVLLQTYIDAPDHPFAQDNLPRGYPDSTTAQLSLLTILQTLLKHEQGHLRSVLLTNIVELNRRCIRDHVPNLANLIIKVDHMMYSSTHPQGPNGNNMAYNGTTKICIAFLQLSIAEFIFHPNRSSPLTSWEVIDRRLQHVKTKSCAFQYA
ncbi:hypothetical protein PCANC_22776 [Puccinia coronata f. sp. avenae]|uniref:Uncharacterized protein n=2 Tax=Puccinia coronata f. sp. avenae TaxID=200324 RepID=A0A2N5U3Y1_9BASI|nr:hypothetical protein PCANC_22776 [Puccinia coronata f. sp. avenae]